jgi:lysophospholipase L1-like esterase
LIGPTDRGILIRRSTKKAKGKIQKGDLLKYSQRHKVISNIQEEEAVKVDCNFWDWQESMGGMGSSYKWLKQNPQLMSKDLIHLTVKGYQVSAQKFINRYNLTKLIDKK